MLRFGTLDVLQLTQPYRDALRGLGDIDDVGGIGPGRACAGNQRVGSLSGGIKAEHGLANISWGRGRMPLMGPAGALTPAP